MRINGLSWMVLLVPPTHPILVTPRGTQALGACDKPTQTIYIDRTLTRTQLNEVLIHELTHAFMFSYAVDVSPKEEELVAKIVGEYGESILRKAKVVYNKLKKRL